MKKRQLAFAFVFVSLFTALSGCANTWQVGMPIKNGNYIPDVNLKGEELYQYYADVLICQKQILSQYGDKYLTNNGISDMRHCLIKKGYVLLS